MCFVNFTREPIIETILSPKDGYKLCIKNSKIAESEELFVDVVEVVSFGHAFFFRGQERPKPFLVPVSDYEIFEVKETRVVLKNVSHDRNIKIGGGREAFVKAPKEQPAPRVEEIVPLEQGVVASAEEAAPVEVKTDKKRDRRRNRRRRLAEERRELADKDKSEEVSSESEDVVESDGVEEVKVSSAMFAHLLPPPPTLISEKLNKMKEKERELAEAAANLAEVVSEPVPVLEAEEVSSKEEEFFT